ncbi:hypothetical protein LCGC14_2050450 [marine sediment metagenome]|uniref:Uncharacterized protein n=1 Tax=marine sediment metagenome TaxID=412755 RepID=A0A0F9EPB3_9ZZZZ
MGHYSKCGEEIMVFSIMLLVLCAFFITGGILTFIDTEQKDKKWHKEHYGELPPWSHIENGALDWTIGTVLIAFGITIAILTIHYLVNN